MLTVYKEKLFYMLDETEKSNKDESKGRYWPVLEGAIDRHNKENNTNLDKGEVLYGWWVYKHQKGDIS